MIQFGNDKIKEIYVGSDKIKEVYHGSDLVWGETPIEGWDGIFADPEVGRVLHANGLIADANKSSIEELATITSLNPSNTWNGSYFYNNKVITQFPELQYCIGLTDLSNTFRNCSNLRKAPVTPEGVTSLYYTFYDCSNLTTVTVIPNSVTDLSGTFGYCSSLLEAPVIPEGVTNLAETFYGCSSIDGIYIINIVTPPTYSSSLSNVQAIYVPDASVDAYKTASGWIKFADKIFPMSNKPQ